MHHVIRAVALNNPIAAATSETTVSKLRGRAARMNVFSLTNASSIELKSRVGRQKPELRARLFARGPHRRLPVDGQVIEHDECPRRSVGTRICSTCARKLALSIGPSKTAARH